MAERKGVWKRLRQHEDLWYSCSKQEADVYRKYSFYSVCLRDSQEEVLYSYQSSQPSAITHWWMSGGTQLLFLSTAGLTQGESSNSMVRFYVDGEATASIEIMIDYAAGIGLCADLP